MKNALFLICTALVASFLFFLWVNHHILFLSPFKTQEMEIKRIPQKKLALFYHQEREKEEERVVLWPKTLQEQLHTIVCGWLTVLKHNHIIPETVTIDAILVDKESQTAYLSFNCHFLQAFEPTIKKLSLLESLGKTINSNLESSSKSTSKEAIQAIVLLVHHQPMEDEFLNLTHAFSLILKYS